MRRINDLVLDKVTGQRGKIIRVTTYRHDDTGKIIAAYLVHGVPISPDYPADRNNPVASWRNHWEISK